MKSKMPDRYYQKAREARRAREVQHARMLRMQCRHDFDPEGSAAWIETGIWPANKPVGKSES